jgi:dipeptide/tripeptide permease
MVRIVPQYALLTFGEILLCTTALEFSYTQAPSAVKAISTALFYSMMSLGNISVVLLKSADSLSRASQLLVFSLLVVGAAIGCLLIGRKFNVLDTHEVDDLDRSDEEVYDKKIGVIVNRQELSVEDVDNSRTPMIK